MQKDEIFANIQEENPVDLNIAKGNWLMYGSRKPDKSAYLASVCINSELKPQSVEKALANYRMGYESRRDGDPRSVADWGVIANLPRILSVKSRG